MKKALFILIIFLLFITGCELSNKLSTRKDGKEEVLEDLNRRCDIAVPEAYKVYKVNHSNSIIDGMCVRESTEEFTIYFKAAEKVLYKYRYSFKESKTTTPDNDNYNTEKYEEYVKMCASYEAEANTKATCANHLIMFDEYDEFEKKMIERPQVYKKIDLSILKQRSSYEEKN